MTETLQYLCDALRFWPTATFLLPQDERFFERIPRQVYFDAVKALGVEGNNCVWLPAGIYRVQRLVVPRQWRYGSREFADRILRNLASHGRAAERTIYVSRASAGYRRISNENAVVEVIRELLPDCEVIRLEEISFAAQVALFRDVGVVVSPHGGGLSNLVFCRPGNLVVEILPASSPYMYHDLALLNRLHYEAYIPANGNHLSVSFEIDLSQFREFLAEVVRQKGLEPRSNRSS